MVQFAHLAVLLVPIGSQHALSVPPQSQSQAAVQAIVLMAPPPPVSHVMLLPPLLQLAHSVEQVSLLQAVQQDMDSMLLAQLVIHAQLPPLGLQ